MAGEARVPFEKGGPSSPAPHPSPENVSSGRSGRSLPPSCGEGDRSPGGDASGARQGTSQDTGKATVQTNKASLFSALHFPHPYLRTICACPRHTFSATARKKLPSQGAFFMRCRFRTKRSQQKQGWRGGRDFRRRAATAVRAIPRSCRGRAPADNTRGGWDGRTGSNGAPPAPAATAWPPQTIAVATKEAAGSDSRDEGALSRIYHSGRFFPAGHDAAPGQFGHHLFRKDRQHGLGLGRKAHLHGAPVKRLEAEGQALRTAPR